MPRHALVSFATLRPKAWPSRTGCPRSMPAGANKIQVGGRLLGSVKHWDQIHDAVPMYKNKAGPAMQKSSLKAARAQNDARRVEMGKLPHTHTKASGSNGGGVVVEMNRNRHHPQLPRCCRDVNRRNARHSQPGVASAAFLVVCSFTAAGCTGVRIIRDGTHVHAEFLLKKFKCLFVVGRLRILPKHAAYLRIF